MTQKFFSPQSGECFREREYSKVDGRGKVLHIALAHGGGVEVYTRMLIEHTYSYYETVLICASEYNKKLLSANACKIYEADVPRKISVSKDIKAVLKIRKIIKKENPNVLYCHSSMAGAIGRMAAIGLKRTVIYNPHGWAFDMAISSKKKMFYRFTEKILALITDKIVTISEHEKRIALKNKICDEDKIEVIYNGIDLDKCKSLKVERTRFGYKEKDFIVGCAARLSEQKDPLLFADVAGYIAKSHPDTRFIWVGDGELRKDFIAALKKNNVFDKTTITGWVNNPCEYISVFDVAVLFSKWEGFGLCLAEYIALGKPVVATNVGAVSEIIQDGVCGKLIERRNPRVIADEIMAYKQCRNNNDINQRCIKSSERFDFKITADKTIKMIAGL